MATVAISASFDCEASARSGAASLRELLGGLVADRAAVADVSFDGCSLSALLDVRDPHLGGAGAAELIGPWAEQAAGLLRLEMAR